MIKVRRSSWFKALTILTSAALALMLASCSSGSGSASGSGPGSKTITIGLDSVLSGPLTVLSAVPDGAKAYLSTINDQGGVNGYKYKFVTKDTAYTGPQTITVTKELVTQDKALAIIGVGTIPITALRPIAPSLDTVIFMAGDGHLFTPPQANMFDITPDYLRMYPFAVQVAKEKLQASSVSLGYENDGTGLPALSAIQAYTKEKGINLAATEGFAASVTDCSPYAAKLKSAGAPVVVIAGNTAPASCLIKADAAIGYEPKYVLGWSALDPAFSQLVGDLAANVYVIDYQGSLTNDKPEVKAYKAGMQKYYPKLVTSSFAEQGWDFGAILNDAVKKITSKKQDLTVKNLEKVLASDYQDRAIALLPSVTFDSTQHYGTTKMGVWSLDSKGVATAIQQFADLPKTYGSE